MVADEYISKYAATIYCDMMINAAYTSRKESKIQSDEIERVIREIPSADVQEVRHGEWKEKLEPCGWFDEPCAECSVCGEDFVLGECDMDDLIKLFKFCPNCGADMRG